MDTEGLINAPQPHIHTPLREFAISLMRFWRIGKTLILELTKPLAWGQILDAAGGPGQKRLAASYLTSLNATKGRFFGGVF